MITDKYKELRDYYKGYGVYNRQGKLIEISTMSDENFSRFQKALATERENFLHDRKGWKVIISKMEKSPFKSKKIFFR